MKKPVHFLQSFINIYINKKLPRASAALAYYLTMTAFPLVICLYTLLGNSYEKLMRIIAFAQHLMPVETVNFLRDFLAYVASNNSRTMWIAGLAVVVSSASAAVRTLQATIGEIQGHQRYQGLWGLLFSLIFSLLFIVAMYLAMIIMLSARSVINMINGFLPLVDISRTWDSLRFLVLAGLFFCMIWGVYAVAMTREKKYKSWPGALLSTVAMVGVSAFFSICISASIKYPLVYGSLASIILLMFWLYACCLVIYCGATVNVLIRDVKLAKEKPPEDEPEKNNK